MNNTTNNSAANDNDTNANTYSNTSNNNDNNAENSAANALSSNSTTNTSTYETINTAINENKSDNNNVNDNTFRTYDNSTGTAEQSLHRARITGPLAQGHPPSPNDLNCNNWNTNAKSNAIQSNTWAINSISRAFGHRSTSGIGNNSSTTSFLRGREQNIHTTERSYRGREK